MKGASKALIGVLLLGLLVGSSVLSYNLGYASGATTGTWSGDVFAEVNGYFSQWMNATKAKITTLYATTAHIGSLILSGNLSGVSATFSGSLSAQNLSITDCDPINYPTKTTTYIVFKQGGVYYAQSGLGAGIISSGSNASVVGNAALTAAASTYGMVYFKQARYDLGASTLLIPPGVSMIGAGKGTVFNYTGSGNAIKFDTATASTSGVYVGAFKVDLSGAANGAVGIYAGKVYRTRFDQLIMLGSGAANSQVGVLFSSDNYGCHLNTVLGGTYQALGWGIKTQQVTAYKVNGLVIESVNDIWQCNIGIEFNYADGGVVHGVGLNEFVTAGVKYGTTVNDIITDSCRIESSEVGCTGVLITSGSTRAVEKDCRFYIPSGTSISDSGTLSLTQLRRVFIPVNTPDTLVGNWQALLLPDSAETHGYVSFKLPDNYQSLSTLKAVVICNGTGNIRDKTGFSAAAAGQAYTTHTSSTSAVDTAATLSQITKLEDVHTLISSTVDKNDYITLVFYRYGAHANDSINSVCWFLGYEFEYIAGG